MTQRDYVLPNGWKIELEFGGHYAAWIVTDTENSNLWSRGEEISLLQSKEAFADSVKESKKNMIRRATMMEANVVQSADF